jgi:hypothetical protein
MTPEHITNDAIKNIGKRYYSKYPKGSFLAWLKHHNHDLADELKAYKENSSSQEKWNFLLAVYVKIKKPTGMLATYIDSLFMRAFKLQKIDKSNGTNYVVIILQGKVRQHFNEKKQETSYAEKSYNVVSGIGSSIHKVFKTAVSSVRSAAKEAAKIDHVTVVKKK